MDNFKINKTKIPGLLLIDLKLYKDERGWFKENWHKAKLNTLGLEDFEPVQNNISFNKDKGVTRGIHGEPWDKFISLAHGEIFTAIVDLRKGDTFGAVETFRIDASQALYVPRGCGNSFQTLKENTTYSYMVNDHWSPEAKYTMVNLQDPNIGIDWPISIDKAIISDKDKVHPFLEDIEPMEA